MARVNYREVAQEAGPRVGGLRGWLIEQPQIAYILPFFAYLLVMAPGSFPTIGGVDFKTLWYTWNPIIYAIKSLVAGLLIWHFWPCYARIRWTHLSLAAVLGIFGTMYWILIYKGCLATGYWHQAPASEIYNPDLMLAERWQRWAYLCIRVMGPAIVVPLMEELFFRDFLMRAFIPGKQFEEVAVGTFSPVSFTIMVLAFGANHASMWPAGIVYGLMQGLLLIRTKSLGACIVAHSVTNWTLYLYVIYTGDWQFM